MQIVFHKIPRLAKLFYLIGFIIVTLSMIIFFNYPSLVAPVRLQQAFIGGAIIVALGSVINTIHQFKRPKPDKKE